MALPGWADGAAKMGCRTEEPGGAPRYFERALHSETTNPIIPMLRWTLFFLVIAILAGVFGFTGIAGTATDIARTLFFIFLVLLIISAIISAFKGRPPV